MQKSIRAPLWHAAAWIVLLAATLGFPATANAICMQPDPDRMAYAEPGAVIFVGTVVDTQVFQQNALVRVEEVWWGGPVPEWQVVIGSVDGGIWSTSTLFEIGRRYLVVAHRDGPTLLDSGCVTEVYSDTLTAGAPADVTAPAPADRPNSWGDQRPSLRSAVLGIGAGLIAVSAAGWFLTRLLRRPEEGESHL